MNRCPECHHENPLSDSSCQRCGSLLVAPATPSPSPREASLVDNEQVIDEREYVSLLEHLQALRQHIRALPRPTDVDPWRFFAPFDRVKLQPGYVPDFVFTPFGGRFFGPGAHTELEQGPFTLTTRRVPLGLQETQGAHVMVMPPIQLHLYPKEVLSLMLSQQGLEGLVFERSVSGFLQFAVFCLEADRWHRNRFAAFFLDADWQWVCSSHQLEAILPAALPFPQWRMLDGVSEEQIQWLRSLDPQLHVRIHGETAEVGGLAYSQWDGFAWLDCELTWPNRFRMKRLETLRIYQKPRPNF